MSETKRVVMEIKEQGRHFFLVACLQTKWPDNSWRNVCRVGEAFLGDYEPAKQAGERRQASIGKTQDLLRMLGQRHPSLPVLAATRGEADQNRGFFTDAGINSFA